MDGKCRWSIVSSIHTEGSKMNYSCGMAQLLSSTTCAQNIISDDDDWLETPTLQNSTATNSIIHGWRHTERLKKSIDGDVSQLIDKRRKSLELGESQSSIYTIVFLFWRAEVMKIYIKSYRFSLLGTHGIDLCWTLRCSGRICGCFYHFKTFSKPKS